MKGFRHRAHLPQPKPLHPACCRHQRWRCLLESNLTHPNWSSWSAILTRGKAIRLITCEQAKWIDKVNANGTHLTGPPVTKMGWRNAPTQTPSQRRGSIPTGIVPSHRGRRVIEGSPPPRSGTPDQQDVLPGKDGIPRSPGRGGRPTQRGGLAHQSQEFISRALSRYSHKRPAGVRRAPIQVK